MEPARASCRKRYGEISCWGVREGASIRRARLAGVAVVVVTTTIAAGYVVLPLAVSGFIRLLVATLNASIWFAAAISSGSDMWTIATAIGRAVAGALATPLASGIIVALVAVGALALFGLQRLLGTEEDSSR
jgi:ABC-type spermidine/putrescine transport system permease subunit I